MYETRSGGPIGPFVRSVGHGGNIAADCNSCSSRQSVEAAGPAAGVVFASMETKDPVHVDPMDCSNDIRQAHSASRPSLDALTAC